MMPHFKKQHILKTVKTELLPKANSIKNPHRTTPIIATFKQRKPPRMKLNTTLPQTLKPYFQEELEAYRTSYKQGALPEAWKHLERAHIIGQKYPYAHSIVHWRMLQFGIRIKSGKEIVGQLPRLLVGGVKSFVGKVPVGNPGGANVPPMRPYPIEQDLQDIFAKAGVS